MVGVARFDPSECLFGRPRSSKHPSPNAEVVPRREIRGGALEAIRYRRGTPRSRREVRRAAGVPRFVAEVAPREPQLRQPRVGDGFTLLCFETRQERLQTSRARLSRGVRMPSLHAACPYCDERTARAWHAPWRSLDPGAGAVRRKIRSDPRRGRRAWTPAHPLHGVAGRARLGPRRCVRISLRCAPSRRGSDERDRQRRTATRAGCPEPVPRGSLCARRQKRPSRPICRSSRGSSKNLAGTFVQKRGQSQAPSQGPVSLVRRGRHAPRRRDRRWESELSKPVRANAGPRCRDGSQRGALHGDPRTSRLHEPARVVQRARPTPIVHHAGKLLALWWQSGDAYRIRLPDLETCGEERFGKPQAVGFRRTRRSTRAPER